MNQKKEMVSDKTMHLESRLQDLEDRFLVDISALEAEVSNLSDAAKFERDELAERVTELEMVTKEHRQLY